MSAPPTIVPALLHPATGFTMSVNRERADFMLFFNFEHPGAPGSQHPVSQVVLPLSTLKSLHELAGRALEYVGADSQVDPGPMELPSNVVLFPPRVPPSDG